MKEVGDEKLKVSQLTGLVDDRIGNIVGKGENAGLPAFSPFPTMFSSNHEVV